MNIILSTFDASLCLMVVAAAAEYLRKIHPTEQPLLALAFYMVAIGAFGDLPRLMHGYAPSLYPLVLHTGVVLYAWARRDQVFQQAIK